MAKLKFCAKTADLRAKLHDGRHEQARREAIDLLRQGYSRQPFLDFVAELLDPPKRGRGAPARPPQRWLEIAEKFHELRDDGWTHEQGIFQVSEEFKCSRETAERAVRIYREAKDTPE